MATLSVIPNFDVLEDSIAGLGPSGPAMTIEQFPAQRGEETFGHRIVITVSTPAHARHELVSGQQFAVIVGGILHAPIGMVQQPWLGTLALHGHAQGGDAEFCIQRFTHGPTDYHTITQVNQYGQIQPTFHGSNVSYISTPNAIRIPDRRHAEAPLQKVTRHRMSMFRVGCLRSPTPLHARPQSRLLHQPHNALSSAVPATCTHLSMNPRTTVSLPAALIESGNQRPQNLVFTGSGTWHSSLGRIEAGSTNLQDSTHRGQRKLVSMQPDAGVLHDFSFAKYAAAFFKKSRSSVTRS